MNISFSVGGTIFSPPRGEVSGRDERCFLVGVQKVVCLIIQALTS